MKIFLDLTLFVQNTWFSGLVWLMSESPNESPKSLNKILKNLSKCFSWLEGPLASKSWRESWILLCKLTIRASIREQVTKLSHENAKTRKFWNFSEYFSQLGDCLARESREHLSLLVIGLTHDWVTKTELHKFWIFWKFWKKKKHFLKPTKDTQKSFYFLSTYD